MNSRKGEYRWMKRILLLTLLLLIIPTTDLSASERDEDLEIDDWMVDHLPLEDLETYWQHIQVNYGKFIDEFSNKSLKELFTDTDKLSAKTILIGIVQYLFHEVFLQSKLLGQLILLMLVFLFLQAIQNAFAESTVSKLAYFVIYIVLIFIVLNSLHLVLTYAKETMEMMNGFMLALIPLLLTLLVTSGQVITVSFLHPLILFMIHVSGLLMTKFVFPLLYLSALLIIVSQLDERFQATQLAQLLKTIAIAVISVFFTIFLGILSLQGAATTVQDGVILKTTKFLSSNTIPVIGRTLTEATDTFLFAAQILKNGVGLIGLLIILFIVVFPLVKMLVIALMYKVTAALIQPLGKNNMTSTLQYISHYIMLVITCMIIVTFMFFLAIVIMTVLSNIPLLMR